MREISTRSARVRSESASQGPPRSMPQWLLEWIRPLAWGICRMLWRIRFTGEANIPLEGGLVVAANHQTYIDPFWISLPMKRPVRYLAWDQAFGWPIVGKGMRLFGAWPLQVEGSDPSAIRRTIQWVREGGAIMIFPEGERCFRDGAMSNFKNGAVRIALEAEVPVLPVTIRGGERIWPKGQKLPRFSRLEIVYHPVLYVSQLPGEDARQCGRRESKRLAEIIRSAI